MYYNFYLIQTNYLKTFQSCLLIMNRLDEIQHNFQRYLFQSETIDKIKNDYKMICKWIGLDYDKYKSNIEMNICNHIQKIELCLYDDIDIINYESDNTETNDTLYNHITNERPLHEYSEEELKSLEYDLYVNDSYYLDFLQDHRRVISVLCNHFDIIETDNHSQTWGRLAEILYKYYLDNIIK